jgi:pyruvate formate lyase activating enzyme
MKACIFDIKRFAVHDGPGIRITIFFKGCKMSCWWCHNPEGIKPEVETYMKETKLDGKVICENVVVGEWITLEDMMKEIEKERIFMDESGGGVTFSGGEPFFQPDFLMCILRECKSRSIHTAIDTSGLTSEELMKQAADLTDLFLYDLKFIDENEHKKYTGISNEQILRNLNKLSERGSDIQIRIPLIPGVNDNPEQIESFIKYISKLNNIKSVDLLPYHHFARSKYRRFNRNNRLDEINKPTESQLEKIKKQFVEAGFSTNIGG